MFRAFDSTEKGRTMRTNGEFIGGRAFGSIMFFMVKRSWEGARVDRSVNGRRRCGSGDRSCLQQAFEVPM
jgi:hypothetical protein